MNRARKHHIVWGNPDQERQLSHVLTQKMVSKHKSKKISLQITNSENQDNNEDTKGDIWRSYLHGK